MKKGCMFFIFLLMVVSSSLLVSGHEGEEPEEHDIELDEPSFAQQVEEQREIITTQRSTANDLTTLSPLFHLRQGNPLNALLVLMLEVIVIYAFYKLFLLVLGRLFIGKE